jgi:hypothetical protein
MVEPRLGPLRWFLLPCQWSNFWPLIMWILSPTHLIRLFWLCVISLCFREWNHSYEGPIPRTFLKFRDTRRSFYKRIQKVTPVALPAMAEILDTVYRLGRKEIILQRTKTNTNGGKRVYRNGLGPGIVFVLVYHAPSSDYFHSNPSQVTWFTLLS